MGRNTIVAAAQAFARIGVTIAPDSVPAASVLWLPTPTVSVSQCDLSAGVPVDHGATMATFASTSPRVTVIDPPGDLLPGARVVIVGEGRYAVDDDGVVQVADLPALGAAGNVDVSASEAKPIDARLALSEPVQVSVVVPSAVFGVDGVRGCVSSRGDRYQVEILGSQLGETIVVFPNGKKPERVDSRPDAHSPCG
ncbi:hypothetical protein ABH923_001498 [Leifsonia sp. EB41]|uniref:hypothetical protein n=1 Tax=Leifsonia sp. EB41 TaxID=3156260 RepID=UPI0035198870